MIESIQLLWFLKDECSPGRKAMPGGTPMKRLLLLARNVAVTKQRHALADLVHGFLLCLEALRLQLLLFYQIQMLDLAL